MPLERLQDLGWSDALTPVACLDVHSLEVHGCYRITGPAVLTQAEVPNAMVASLGKGSTIEFFDPDGNILIPLAHGHRQLSSLTLDCIR